MASIGHADLIIVPKFNGLTNAVNTALGGVNMSSGGKKAGGTFVSGFKSAVGTGAVMGAVSAITTSAIDAVASRVDDAVSRLDTLKNYPQVMTAIGVSAKEADSSINTMSERLKTLPTRLDAMASSTQGVYAATKDYGVSLQTATDASLAMNDLLLSGGQGMEVTNAAMEQFRQMLAKGKPEMQDWKALLSAAPGQMDQLAKSMLGPTANANDLYAALGGGQGNEATISMNELLDALIKLDKEGGAGLESLQKQAEKATGGIETSAENAGNAITRGLAGTMDAIGRDRIAGVFNDIRGGIDSVFGIVQAAAPVIVDSVSGIVSGIASAAPALLGLAAGVAAFTKLGPALKGITTLPLLFTKIGVGALSAAGSVGSAAASMAAAFNPVTLGVAAAAATLVYFGTQAVKTAQENEKIAKATSTFNDAVARSDALSYYAKGVEGIGTAAASAKYSVSDFYTKLQQHADAMQQNNEQAEKTIGTLNTVQDAIDEYAGKAADGVKYTDLSAEAQGRLTYAVQQLNEQFGLTLTAEDVLNGAYVDQDGNVQNLKQSVDELCAARREEARMAALSANLKEAYGAQADAVERVEAATAQYKDAYDGLVDSYNSGKLDFSIYDHYETADAYAKASLEANGFAKEVDDANAAVADANDKISTLQGELGLAGTDAGKLKDALVQMSTEGGDQLVTALAKSGVKVGDLARAMADAGVSTEQLASIGADNLAALASACDGNVGLMVNALTALDGISLKDKHFSVDDDGTITFKSGELSALELQALHDKGFEVYDDGTVLTAKRNVDELSGSINAIPPNVSTTVKANVEGKSLVDDLASSIRSATGWFTANISARISGIAGGVATGGVSHGANLLNGAIPARGLYDAIKSLGGIKPLLHAAGGIATGPTLTSVGFVGEEGAEAIVPLTNMRYVKPFASAIAGEMRGNGGQYSITIHASDNANDIAREVTRAIRAQNLMSGRR